MELRHLRYFTAVAAHGSFSRAGHHLHLTQPALSRQVKDLEEELGLPLLVRGKNFVSLTDAGELFYEEARDLLARADNAVQRVRARTKGETLRIGYVPSLTAGVLPRALERFQNTMSRVRVELVDLPPGEIHRQGSAGLVDLVITAADSESQVREFQWTEVRTLSPVLLIPKNHPLARLKRIAPERLRDLPLIGLDRSNFPEYAKRLRVILKPFGVVPQIIQTADGISTLFAALEARMAAAVLTDAVSSFLPQALAIRPFSPGLAPVSVVAGMSSLKPSPHAELFTRLFREEAAKSHANAT